MHRAPLLEVTALRKRFDGKTVLDGLTFELGRGEVLGLLGPNGAGKTTTFLCLCGLLRPDGGTIAFEGRALGGERAGTVALIPETPEIYPMLTVWEHLAFVARSARVPAGWESRADALLERFGLTEKRDVLGQALSKGMRQKTLIAATVLAGSPVVLFDEPMTGLDPRGQRELRDLIADLARTGTSVMLSTHLIDTAAAMCDRIIIMKSGAVVAQGAVSELRASANGERSLEEAFFELTG
jgi:ABC-type multidrug transport system ATPase subunit